MANVYNIAKRKFMDKEIDLDADTLKVLLISDASTKDLDDDDVTTVIAAGAEVSCTGYVDSTGRETLGATTGSTDDANDLAFFDVGDTTFSSLGGAANDNIAAAVIYQSNGTDGQNIPIAWYALTSTSTNGGDITIQWSTGGFLRLTES